MMNDIAAMKIDMMEDTTTATEIDMMEDTTATEIDPNLNNAVESSNNLSNEVTVIDLTQPEECELMNGTSIKTKNCYCNDERNFNIVELLCANCNQWYHESCIGYKLEKLMPFMLNYTFVCKNCSSSGLEDFKKKQALISQLCVTTMANLTQESIKNGSAQVYFSLDKDILPFIEKHWDNLTTAKRATKLRNSSFLKSLLDGTINSLYHMVNDADDRKYFKLLLDLSEIKPNYERMVRNGELKITDHGLQLPVSKKHLSKKRAQPDTGKSSLNSKKKDRTTKNQPYVLRHGYPLEHPFNTGAFKYILVEPDPHVPCKEQLNQSAVQVLRSWNYRVVWPNKVLLALHDRAPQLHISDSRLSVTGEKGYCLIRATHSVSHGNWYWELTVEKKPENTACRIGWGQEFANLQTPLGADEFGYSWRSRKGTVFHKSRGKHYSDGYDEGDTLGMMICLPRNNVSLPPTYKENDVIKFKSHLYFRVPISSANALKDLKPLIGSKIIFYKNGVCLNEGAVDVYEGNYFPSVSLFKNCEVSVNFGPDFKYPPPQTDDFKYLGVWERATETICEQTLADLSFFTNDFDPSKC